MPSEACRIVHEELMFLGDILCYGIVRKGLEKVGSMPDIATPGDLVKAIDGHVEVAIKSFVGPNEARKITIRIKARLSKMEAS
jgi:hypothetical protein